MSILFQEDVETGVHLDPAIKEVQYNPTYETMFAPEVRKKCWFLKQKCLLLKGQRFYKLSVNFL